VNIESSVEFDP